MTIQILCDGCGKPLDERAAHAEVRVYGAIHLSDTDRRDWCTPCTAVAVAAVKNNNKPERNN